MYELKLDWKQYYCWVCDLNAISVHALNDRFPNLLVLNATKIFNPSNYPSNDSDWITNIELWPKRILLRFQYTKEESDMCKRELSIFTKTFQHECENETIFEVWRMCSSNLKWHTNWPKFIQLWQKIIFIPSSIAICERGFSKQNAIKSHLGNKLNLKTLDALMQVSLCGLEVDAMDGLLSWRNMRDRRILMFN